MTQINKNILVIRIIKAVRMIKTINKKDRICLKTIVIIERIILRIIHSIDAAPEIIRKRLILCSIGQ
jgi:hypothetical protein